MKKDKSREERIRQARAFFHRRWNEIDLVIDYNQDWESPFMEKESLLLAQRLGRIEYSIVGMLKDPEVLAVEPGQLAKTMDDYGRKFIVVGTRLGPWVFFVLSKDVQESRLGDQRGRKLKQYQLEEVHYSRTNLALYLGSPSGLYDGNFTIARNIGQRMELVFEMMQDPAKEPLAEHFYIQRHKAPK